MRVVAAVTIALAAAVPLLAHEGSHATPGGTSRWDAAVLAALLVAAGLYTAGTWRLARRGVRTRRVERAAFWIGWLALVAAVAPPLDHASSLAFSMHMVQHELLMLVGAPLVVLGRPVVPWLWALPQSVRTRTGATLRWRPVHRAWQWMTTPLTAWVLHGAAIWTWHLPALYESAVENESVHALQHASFVGTAILFWWGLVYGKYGRVAYGASVLYVFTTMVHTGILGAMFALSTGPFFDIYVERAAAAGVDPTADQQLAGLVMWIPAGIVLTLFGLALLAAWIGASERRPSAGSRPLSLVLPLVLAASMTACGVMQSEADARRLTGGDPHRGRERIRTFGCDSCHTIPGIPGADATVGPPLDRVAQRVYLAGHVPNTPENMMRWIEDPPALDSRTVMPDMGISREDSRDIAAYLYTLR
jgi:cytochrome c oxidase assembly factor CtaG/cytochrome c2